MIKKMERKDLLEALNFVCSLDFWRMSIFWTIFLIASYLQLFSQRFFFKTLTNYVHSSHSLKKTSDPVGIDALRRPICVITGATSGLGAAAASALSMHGFYLVLVGRSTDLLAKTVADIKKQNVSASVQAFQVDVSSFESILKFKASLQEWLLEENLNSSIQLLINNAGILATTYRLNCDDYDQMMATNYIGAFCLTHVLLPLLENSPVPSRVINVTSFTHRSVRGPKLDHETVTGKCFSRSKYPFARIYEYSKFCLLLFTYELHRRIGLMEKSHQVSVIAVDPGAVKTNIMREFPSCLTNMANFTLKVLGMLQSPDVGASSILDAALAGPEVSGVYFFGGNMRTIKSSPVSYSTKLSEDLWATSSDIFLQLQLIYNCNVPDQ